MTYLSQNIKKKGTIAQMVLMQPTEKTDRNENCKYIWKTPANPETV